MKDRQEVGGKETQQCSVCPQGLPPLCRRIECPGGSSHPSWLGLSEHIPRSLSTLVLRATPQTPGPQNPSPGSGSSEPRPCSRGLFLTNAWCKQTPMFAK